MTARRPPLEHRDLLVDGAQILLGGLGLAAVSYLCALALSPGLAQRASEGRLDHFGAPGSTATIWVIVAIPALLALVRRIGGRTPTIGPPIVALAVLAAVVGALGLSSYWGCHGDQTAFFAPLAWTLQLFIGEVQEPFGEGAACASMPVALETARLFAIAATLGTAVAAALTIFRTQLDRVATWRARSLTVVVGLDDETVSIVRAISRTLTPGMTLLILTGDTNSEAARAVREFGARLRAVDLTDPRHLGDLRLWNRVARLYLLSRDPAENLKRFKVIDTAVRSTRDTDVRRPLTIRIDDPWQAEVWRRAFLSSTERRWVADAVGRYEITAAKLVRHITRRSADKPEPPSTVVLCGLNPITYAVASELAQLRRDQALYADPDVVAPSDVVVFDRGARSFIRDHQIRQARMAPEAAELPMSAHDHEPTVDAVDDYLGGRDTADHAVVLGDPAMEIAGNRLASRHPELRVYLASTVSESLVDFSIIGRLYNFPVDMELDESAPQDVWERAAELIHEHYSAERDRSLPSARPWRELDPFIRGSNRRAVINALWMVETVADHTWNSIESGPAAPLPADFGDLDPLHQLALLGFDDDVVTRMVQVEHEDWRRYYQAAGWRYAEQRDDRRRHHTMLLPWEELLERNPECICDMRRSLASILINLRSLGFRSIPRTASTSAGRLQDV